MCTEVRDGGTVGLGTIFLTCTGLKELYFTSKIVLVVTACMLFNLLSFLVCLPWGGSKAVSHVADLRGMSKNPGFTWKSKSQAKLTGHFSP